MKVIQLRNVARDIFEIYMPILAFCILFISFVYSIFARYVFNAPPAWATEIQVGTYIWTVMLSAAYVRRIDKHVKFDILYDHLSEKWKCYFRIFRNLLMGITYVFLFIASISYISRYRTLSPYFRIPVKIYFCPIIYLSFSVMLYSIFDAVKDIRTVIAQRKQGGEK